MPILLFAMLPIYNSVTVTLASGRRALWIICNACQHFALMPDGPWQAILANAYKLAHGRNCRKMPKSDALESFVTRRRA